MTSTMPGRAGRWWRRWTWQRQRRQDRQSLGRAVAVFAIAALASAGPASVSRSAATPVDVDPDVIGSRLKESCAQIGINEVESRQLPDLDVTKDGVNDHVVTSRCKPVTSDHSWVTTIVDGTSSADAPRILATVPEPKVDITDVLSVRSEGDAVMFDGVGHGPSASNARPDRMVSVRLTWNGSQLGQQAPQLMNLVTGESFAAPSGNISCDLGADYARCQIYQQTWADPPASPSECPGNHAFTVNAAGARPESICGDEGEADKVDYNTVVSVAPYRFLCSVQTTGVRCWDNQQQRGFTMSRETYTFF